MTQTATTNLHPCPACGLNAPRTVDAAHRLCDGCAADLPATLAHVETMLRAAKAAAEQHSAAWVARLEGLPEPVAHRWAALVAARSAAEGRVIAYERGRLSAALSEKNRRAHLEEAYKQLATVKGKIERTRAAVPDLARLLDEEERHNHEAQRLRADMLRWEQAMQDVLDAMPDGMPF